jgi:hypothetical protein
MLVGVGRGTSSEGKLLQVEEEMGFQANSLMSSVLLNPQDLAMEYHCCFAFPKSLEISPRKSEQNCQITNPAFSGS